MERNVQYNEGATTSNESVQGHCSITTQYVTQTTQTTLTTQEIAQLIDYKDFKYRKELIIFFINKKNHFILDYYY